MQREKAVLIIDSTDSNADLLYATGGFSVPDPVVFIKHGDESILVLNDLELSRGRKKAAVSEIVSLSQYTAKLRANGKGCSLADIAGAIFRERKISRVEVQKSFPVFFADSLRKKGFKISCSPSPILFEERIRKSPPEVSLIRKSLRDTASAMRTAADLIFGAKPGKDGVLFSNGKELTSEAVKRAINSELAGGGYAVSGTIVACGEHSAMPHHCGEGPIFASRPVVMDIFPRSAEGYFGDMTRTVVAGKPPPVLARMYRTVLKGQKIAVDMIRHGVKSADIHKAVLRFFDSEGFETNRGKDPQGFIHSTGHGLGMALHEPPSIGAGGDILEKGNVVTVEPGLYYEGLGGVRIEDVVLVTEKGCENLTRCAKTFSRKL